MIAMKTSRCHTTVGHVYAPPPQAAKGSEAPRGVLPQPFNQRLRHQTQHRPNMLSVFKKSGRRSHAASSTSLNQPIREYYYLFNSSYFRLTHRSASSSYSPQPCLIGADRRAGRHCDERD